MPDDDTESVLETHKFVVQRIRETHSILRIVERPTDDVLLCRILLVAGERHLTAENTRVLAKGLHRVLMSSEYAALSFYATCEDALQFVETSMHDPQEFARCRGLWHPYNEYDLSEPAETMN